VNHRLLVAALVVAEPIGLVQRLSNPGDVAMPENSKDAGKKALALPVALNMLNAEELD
jgi:hypothetical protein